MSNQRGFTIVEGLLVVIVLLIIGFAGYTVWNNSQDEESTETPTAQQENNTASEPEASSESDNEAGEQSETATRTMANNVFSVEVPEEWVLRSCLDHEGFVALTAGASGELKCISSDANWLEIDISSRARVAVGASSSPYPRQDYTGGVQKNIYETDAVDLTLSDDRVVKKYTYVGEKTGSKGEYFDVVEYTHEDVSFFVFGEGSTVETVDDNGLTTAEIVSLMEEVVLPSLKLK